MHALPALHASSASTPHATAGAIAAAVANPAVPPPSAVAAISPIAATCVRHHAFGLRTMHDWPGHTTYVPRVRGVFSLCSAIAAACGARWRPVATAATTAAAVAYAVAAAIAAGAATAVAGAAAYTAAAVAHPAAAHPPVAIAAAADAAAAHRTAVATATIAGAAARWLHQLVRS